MSSPASALSPTDREDIGKLARVLADPLSFAVWASRGKFVVAPHHRVIADAIAPCIYEPVRVLVSLPPRHGKTWLLSQYVPAWFLANRPDKRVLHVSHSNGTAIKLGSRKVRDILARLASELGCGPHGGYGAPQQEWRMEENGEVYDESGMFSVGMGGGIMGSGGDLLEVDDPVATAADAHSPTVRANHVDYYDSGFASRAEPGASIVGIMHRWHEADLFGYLLSEQAGENWKYIRLPAIAEADEEWLGRDGSVLMRRKKGEALWPERYDLAALERKRTNAGAYWWSALYQGTPQVGDGAVFRSQDFRKARLVGSMVHLVAREGEQDEIWDVSALRKVLAADTAIKTGFHNDYTVICVLAFTPRGDAIVWDVWRARTPVPDQWPNIRRMMDKHKPHAAGVEVKASGPGIIEQAKREFYRLTEIPAEVDKGLRAQPVADAYGRGAVFHLERAPWLDVFERELVGFPLSEHDDQVDALAHCFTLGRSGVGMGSALPPRPRGQGVATLSY